jgi:type I pantothenate kinase
VSRSDGFAEVVERVAQLRMAHDPVVVGVAGSVAVGKTTFAARLAEACGGVVVSTDGFLLPNSVLEQAGLLDRKGFPESFDVDALIWFLQTVRTDEQIDGLPRYSHDTFDVEPSPEPFIRQPVVIVEGVNALQPEFVEHLDLRIYLDADVDDIVAWYTARFETLTAEARTSGEGFYTRFAAQTPDQLRGTAQYVWDLINAPNLHRYIAPTRANADIVITKRADHSIE